MQGYFKNPSDQIVVFDAFYRRNPCDGGYAISCGLADVIEYIKNLHFSYDDIQYLKSLNIFEDDFLDYLAGFHFTGDIWVFRKARSSSRASPCSKSSLRSCRHSSSRQPS